MSHLKKFSDFFAVFGLCSALIYLLTQYIPFEALEAESTAEKIKFFFSAKPSIDYFAYAFLAALFLLSFLVAKIWPHLSALNFGLSLLPIVWSFFMLAADKFQEYPMLYLLCALFNGAGAFADSLIADRTDGKKRAVLCADLCAAVLAVLALAVFLRSEMLAGSSAEEWNFLDRAIGPALENGSSFSPYWRVALMYALTVVISRLLKDVYFVDAAVSLIPLCFTLAHWHEKTLPAYGASVAALAVCYTICRLTLTFFPLSKKSDEASHSPQ